jgi:hypothetical protein
MRRSLVISIGALALACAPAALFAQDPPAAAPAAPAEKPAPKLALTSPAAVLLVQIKPDQTAAFEELAAKLKAGLAKTDDATLKQQAAGFKIYKAAEPFASNALYVITIEPVVKDAEYELFAMLQKVMTREELSAPEAVEMWKRFSDAFAAGLSRLSLTPVGGDM